MKKNILIIVLVLISGMFLVFSKIKAIEAQMQREENLELNELVKKLREKGETLKKQAELISADVLKAQAEALRQKQITDRTLLELQECQSK